jgi:hypothetical protein
MTKLEKRLSWPGMTIGLFPRADNASDTTVSGSIVACAMPPVRLGELAK